MKKTISSVFAITVFIYHLIAGQVKAQDLTGIWKGTLYSDGYEHFYEVQINQQGKAIKGISYVVYKNPHSLYKRVFDAKCAVLGNWSPAKKTINFKDKLLHRNGYIDNVYSFYLSYKKTGDKEILEGQRHDVDYSTQMELLPCACGCQPPETIQLVRVKKSLIKKEDFIIKKENELAAIQRAKDSIKLIKQMQVLAKRQNATTGPNLLKDSSFALTSSTTPPIITELPKVLTERTSELYKTIPVNAKEFDVDFYDNAEIDGDTISIYLNGKLLAEHQGLGIKPISFKIKINEKYPEQEIAMVAENLGSIPPNTALMIVQVGNKRYEVSLASTQQKNAIVRFMYQKE